jgi:hypothetical protein
METPRRYVRFVLPFEDEDTRRAVGVFQVRQVVGTRRVVPLDRRICEAFSWFGDELPVPPVVKTRREALSWFRREPERPHEPEAREPLRRAFLLVSYLRASGIAVETVQTRDPGEELYRDRWQIVAVPRGTTETGRVR